MTELLAPHDIDTIHKLMAHDFPTVEAVVQSEEAILESILDAGVLDMGSFEYSNGCANNRLSLERLFTRESAWPALHVVVAALGTMAMRYEPNVLWGVPTGGHRFAAAVGQVLDLPVIGLRRNRDSESTHVHGAPTKSAERVYEIASPEFLDADGMLHEELNAVGIKDVSHDFRSVQRALHIESLKRATSAVVVAWGRGEDPADSNVWGMGVELKTLVYEPIPYEIHRNHPFHPEHVT